MIKLLKGYENKNSDYKVEDQISLSENLSFVINFVVSTAKIIFSYVERNNEYVATHVSREAAKSYQQQQHYRSRNRLRGAGSGGLRRISFPSSAATNASSSYAAGGGYLFSKRLRQSTATNSDSLCDALLADDSAEFGGFCASPPSQSAANSQSAGGAKRHHANRRKRHLRYSSSPSASRKTSKKFVVFDFRGETDEKVESIVMKSDESAGHAERSMVIINDLNDAAEASANESSSHQTAALSTSTTEIDDSLRSIRPGDLSARRFSPTTLNNNNLDYQHHNNNSRTAGISANFNNSVSGIGIAKSGETTTAGIGELTFAGIAKASEASSYDSPKAKEIGKKRKRKWQEHAGGNRFFCNGRIIVSRQCSILFLTVFLIVFTMTLFCVFDLPFLAEKVSMTLPFVAGVLFLLVMSSLFKTSFSDPGILPRAPLREVIEWDRQLKSRAEMTNNAEWTPPRTKIVQIGGQNIKLKYCFTCCLFRPPRSSHCSICDNCILNFDHHCPWVGNCVGLRNYRHFYFFISILSILDCFIGACVTIHLVMLTNERGTFLEAIKASPSSIFTGIITLISIWSIVGLSGFHTYLIAINQTTNEDIKGTFSSKNRPSIRNPYASNCFRNIFTTLFGPEPPSLLDRRGIVEENRVVTVDAEVLRLFGEKFQSLENFSTEFGGSNSTAAARSRSSSNRGSQSPSRHSRTWAMNPSRDVRRSSCEKGSNNNIIVGTRNSAHLRNAVAPIGGSGVVLSSSASTSATMTAAASAVQCVSSTAAGCGASVAPLNWRADSPSDVPSSIRRNPDRTNDEDEVMCEAGAEEDGDLNRREELEEVLRRERRISSRKNSGVHERLRRLSAHSDTPHLVLKQ